MAEVKQESPGGYVGWRCEKIAEHFGAYPENCAYELEFPVRGDLSVVK